MIEYGDSAVDDGSFADWVWVGLASGWYYSHLTNDLATPLYNTQFARTDRVKALLQLNDAPPYLPKAIDYYFYTNFDITIRPGLIWHLADHNWKSGEVRVLQVTNINRRIFPTEYTYEQFRPNVENPISTNDVQHQFWATIKVKKIILQDVPNVISPEIGRASCRERV